MKKKESKSLRSQGWKHFKKNRPALFSVYIISFLILVAILAPLLANEKPLYCSYKGEALFPAFSFKKNYFITGDDGVTERIDLKYADWKHMELDKVIWAPVPWSPGVIDRMNTNYKSPGEEQFFSDASGMRTNAPGKFRHILGTNGLGEDTMAGLIHGTRISLTIGIISMGIAAFIGILFGALAGFFGDNRLKTSRGRFWFTIAGIFFAWFYAFQVRKFELQDAISSSSGDFMVQLLFSILIAVVITWLFSFTGKYIGKIKYLDSKVHIPVDSIISRMIEIIISLPTLILIITIASIAKPSLVNIMVLIGLTQWTGIARFTRAEFLRLKNLDYIQAARSLGYSEIRTITRHALPNGLAPALVTIAFGIAGAILTESALSFLGIGVPPETVTWGSLVSEGKANYHAWWLVVFPGVAIFLTVTAYNLIGEGLRDALDPRLTT